MRDSGRWMLDSGSAAPPGVGCVGHGALGTAFSWLKPWEAFCSLAAVFWHLELGLPASRLGEVSVCCL